MVELRNEGDAVHVAARRQAQGPERRRHGAALTGERELQEVQRVEVGRVLGEAGRGGVLNTLVHRQNGDVSGAAETPVIEQSPEIAQHRGATVAVAEDPVEIVGPGEREVLGRERLGRVAQESVRILAEELVESAHGTSLPGSRQGHGEPGDRVERERDRRIWLARRAVALEPRAARRADTS